MDYLLLIYLEILGNLPFAQKWIIQIYRLQMVSLAFLGSLVPN